MKIKTAFGRCNIPHLGHKYLIDQVDLFILSDGKRNLPVDLRIHMLEALGVNRYKILVCNPYKYYSEIDNGASIVVINDPSNYKLIQAIGKNQVDFQNKQFSLSSTLIRSLAKNKSFSEIIKLYNGRSDLLDNILAMCSMQGVN